MTDTALDLGAEVIRLEPVNARGGGLVRTEACLRETGETEVAKAISTVRREDGWSKYARRLIENAVAVARETGFRDRLYVLLCRRRLEPNDRAALKPLPGIVWL